MAPIAPLRRVMRTIARPALLAALCSTLLGSSTLARADDQIPYLLVDPSSFNFGCFDGCACPVVTLPLGGEFRLRLIDADPLFTHYAVENFDARFAIGPDSRRLTGEGTYRIGGEVALMQEMILDLRIDEGEPRRYESGLVSGGSEFPAIVIQLARHGFACFDTVIDVNAKPATAGAPGPRLTSRLEAAPNPFRGATELGFALVEAGSVDVGIYDPGGRSVRSLLRGAWLSAGRHAVPWDGLASSGSPARPGVYFARIRTALGERTLHLVKLE